MLEKKIWPLLIALVLCLSIWQITGPGLGPPYEYHTVPVPYTLSASNSSAFTYPPLPSGDYERLMGLTTFKFTILNSCNNTAPLLLVLIHTSPTNYAKRKTIRETWGQSRVNMKIVFMVGVVKNETVMSAVEEENKVHRDFAQGDFLDSYRNMTYKHIMLFKYAIYHCPHAKYILKTDDDVFVNMPRMMDFLNFDLSPHGTHNLLFCTPYHNARVMRSYRSKWRVGFREYPGKYYPAYCPGWALLYSPDILFALYSQAQDSKYFWIDDVLITGTLVKKLQIEHTEYDMLTMPKETLNLLVEGHNDDVSSFLYGTPDLTELQIRKLWFHVAKDSRHRSVFQNKK